jgi:hypothetical protein
MELFRERVKSWKLRRGDGERVFVSGSWRVGVVGSAGGVSISWVCVSERMSVNSGVWGAVGWLFLGSGSLLSSSRLWRMLRREGMVAHGLADAGVDLGSGS